VVGSHVLLAVGRRPNTDDLGCKRRVSRRTDAAILSSMRVANERARNLGAGRLQRPGGIHAHGLQRL
jgi:hypothetical protein